MNPDVDPSNLANPDAGSGVFLNPGIPIWDGKNPDPEWEKLRSGKGKIRIRDGKNPDPACLSRIIFPRAWEQFLGTKNT